MDQDLFKAALSRWGSGISVITTSNGESGPLGFTATSFCSLSLEPPLVLFCLSQQSQLLADFQNADGFAVNFLHAEQEALSNLFASSNTDKFQGVELLAKDSGGLPLLGGCLANLVCKKEEEYPGGDHRIFVGRVMDVVLGEGDPLLYFKGKYRML